MRVSVAGRPPSSTRRSRTLVLFNRTAGQGLAIAHHVQLGDEMNWFACLVQVQQWSTVQVQGEGGATAVTAADGSGTSESEP